MIREKVTFQFIFFVEIILDQLTQTTLFNDSFGCSLPPSYLIVFDLSCAFYLVINLPFFLDRPSMGLPPDPSAAKSNTPTADIALIGKRIEEWTKYFNRTFDESQRADNSFVISFETKELEHSVEVQLTLRHRDSLDYICFSTFRFRNQADISVYKYFVSGLLVLMCNPH